MRVAWAVGAIGVSLIPYGVIGNGIHYYRAPISDGFFRHWGCGIEILQANFDSGRYLYIGISQYVFLTLGIALAASACFGPFIRRKRRATYRRQRGLCTQCGYDRRASPTKCPECGTEPMTPGGSVPDNKVPL